MVIFCFFSCEHPQNNINTMQHKVVSYRTPMCNVLLNNYRARLLKTKCFYSWLQTIANMSCSNLLTWGSCKELLGCTTHNDILSMLRVVGLALSASRVMLQNSCCGLKKQPGQLWLIVICWTKYSGVVFLFESLTRKLEHLLNDWRIQSVQMGPEKHITV